ncbi:Protein NBR1 [Glycine soja]
MDSALVIKVKYGDTLRRFSAHVDENNRLDLDMVGLRAKICSIFSFSADENLILRYVDEDGDLVTLVDDDDLRDVMRQQLKFLRIDVHMNSGDKSNAGSSGSATPSETCPVTSPFLLRNAMVREHLSKKAASSSPVVDNLANSIMKMGLNSHFQPRDTAGESSKTGVPEEPITKAMGPQSSHVDSASNASVNSDSATPIRSPIPNPYLSGNAVKVDISCSVPEPVRQFFSKSSSSNAAASSSQLPANLADLISLVPEPVREFLSNLSHSNAASSNQLPVNLTDLVSLLGQSILNSHCQPHVATGPFAKNGVPEEPITSEARGQQIPSADSASNATQQVEAGVATIDLNAPPFDPFLAQFTCENKAPLSSEAPNGHGKKGKMPTVDSSAGKGDSSGISSSFAAPNNSTQTTSLTSGAFIECPFAGTYINSWTPLPGNSQMPPFKRSHSHTDAMSGMFHKGVRCDGCGVYPITGPRFKSKVKENYDLCNICFNEMGNGTDYIRMDRPASARAPRYLHGHTKNFPTLPPHIFKKGAILKHAKPKLDSRFILDVNVIDGTMMAPSTAFTKIWRMRNNGTIVWHKGTQLVWIGGDKFSDSHSVDLEVPEDGVPLEKELDIAVDFTAPPLPGRYISYWRMTTPSGHQFGQRVWVLIQVDASLKDSFYDNSQGLNLNIPLDISGSKGPHIIDINVQPTEDDTVLQTRKPNAPIEPLNQMVDEEPRLELENEFPINEATFVAPVASAPAATSVASSSVPCPIIDLSETTPAVPSNQQSPTVDVPSSSMGTGGGINSVEENLLKELEEMGFKQVDLNKEILRKNEYDLDQSLDALCGVDVCGVSEWDHMLEELQEMGFRDKEMNKRLLEKNNGSLKRVVMDLINGE